MRYPLVLRRKDALKYNLSPGTGENNANVLSEGVAESRFHLTGNIPPVRLRLACEKSCMTVLAYAKNQRSPCVDPRTTTHPIEVCSPPCQLGEICVFQLKAGNLSENTCLWTSMCSSVTTMIKTIVACTNDMRLTLKG